MKSGSDYASLMGWIGRVTVTHVLTYFVSGIVFFNLFGYTALYAEPEVATFLRQTTDPMVIAGPFLQLIRGPIIALGLLPARRVVVNHKQGWLVLWGIMAALMILAPAGAAPGSIEGLIYTKVPLWFHLVSLPEVILQALVFSWLTIAWERRAQRK